MNISIDFTEKKIITKNVNDFQLTKVVDFLKEAFKINVDEWTATTNYDDSMLPGVVNAMSRAEPAEEATP